MDIKSEYGFLERYNMVIGILICSLFTGILQIIMPIYFVFFGDMYFVAGCCLGLYFTFKKKQDSQSHIKTGIIVGLVGSVLALFFIDLFSWIYYSLYFGFDFGLFLNYLLVLIVNVAIMYIFVGVILGYLFGYYFRGKEGKEGNVSVSSRF